MAGEHIEDLKINLIEMDNKKADAAFNFTAKPANMNKVEFEHLLSKSMDPEIVKSVLNDPETSLLLQKEYQQILKDRDDLRHIILKRQEDFVHLCVNVPRIIWNAKEQF